MTIGLLLILASAVLISYGFLLVRLFSYVYWGDFSFFIIAVAMFGFSLSGVLIATVRRRRARFSSAFLFAFTLLAAISFFLAPRLFLLIPFQPILIFHYLSEFFHLLAGSLLLGLPFLLGYFVIGAILVDRVERIGIYYGLNLIGSALGGVFFTFILSRFPFSVQFKILPLLLLLPLFFRREKRYLPVVSLVALIILFTPFPRVVPSDFKDISRAGNAPEYTTVREEDTPSGKLSVLSSPLYRDVPGLSLNFSGKLPGHYLFFQNGDTIARLPLDPSLEQLNFLDYLPTALPYLLRRPRRVLYLYTEGGEPWLQAPYFAADEVTLILGNRYHREMLNDILSRTGYYGVSPSLLNQVTGGPRAALEKEGVLYDLIEVNLTGGATYRGGMRSNYILTFEGIIACGKALSDQGILSITTAIKNPPRIVPRMLNLLNTAGERSGWDLKKHLLIYRGWKTATFLIFAGEITEKDIGETLSFLEERSFDPVYFPGITADLVNRNNRLDGPVYYQIALRTLGERGENAGGENYFDFSPPTDERPFFYYFNPFFRAITLFIENKDLALNLITFDEMMLFLTLLISLVLGLVFLIFPAAGLFMGRKKSIPLSGALYFLAIGFGFLFIEILLIQKLNRFTGDYLISFIIVLSGMLLAAGAGSWLLSPLVEEKKKFAAVTLVFLFVLYLPLYLLLDFNQLYKSHPIVFFVLLGGLGLMTAACMGIYFPGGMKMVRGKGRLAPAWMWAFSGLASVIAPAAETVLSIRAGFHTIFITSILLYLLALAIALGQKDES